MQGGPWERLSSPQVSRPAPVSRTAIARLGIPLSESLIPGGHVTPATRHVEAFTREPFTVERAEPLLTAAADQTGLPLPAPRLLRLRENAEFSTGAQVVARVGRSPAAAPTAAREVAIGSWLAHATEVPVASPIDVAQPILVEGHHVTFWEEMPDPSEASFRELAGAHGVLHAVDLDEVPAAVALPKLDPFNRISSRIESAPIPEQQRSVLRSVYDELVEAWDTRYLHPAPGADPR